VCNYIFIILLFSKSWLLRWQDTATSGQRDRGVVVAVRRRNSIWNNLFAPVGGNDRRILCKETNRFYSRTWPGYRLINLWYFISRLDEELCLVCKVSNFGTKWRGSVFYLAALKRFSIKRCMRGSPLNLIIFPYWPDVAQFWILRFPQIWFTARLLVCKVKYSTL
jgi:hypothetical protein